MRLSTGACLLLLFPALGQPADLTSEQRALLAVHEAFKAAHLRSDPDAVLQRLSADYVRVARGEVSHPSSRDLAAEMRAYLGSVRFSEYRDLQPPIVKVSADGTLGWIVVRLRARGVRALPDGGTRPVDFVCAWVALYEKRGGEWVAVGDASTFGD